MTNLPRTAPRNMTAKIFLTSFVALSTIVGSATAQTRASKPADRISGAISNSSRAELSGSAIPRAMHSTDLGAIAANTPLQGIRITFSRTAAQQNDLNQLIADQQTPGSALFHQWLTPTQFGARFGVSDNDLAATESWLQSQGFTIDAVSPSRDSITFSGSASSVESGFGTPLHYFKATSGSLNTSDLTTHFAPVGNLTIPAALSSVVLSVGNLSDYHARSHSVQKPGANFTSGVSGSHFMTPKDIATVYDINAAYSLGYSGSGQTIAVVGRTAVSLTDVSNFQTAAGVTANVPILTLVPNSGTATTRTGDQSESDLDLEYTSSIANKATINFVYTGSNTNYDVFDAMVYAIQNNLAQVISVSYGECEPDLPAGSYAQYESALQQAATQGQTVVNSSGDSGSTSCSGDGSSTANQQQVAVSYPASSAYVSGIGGTEFTAAAVAACTNTYFTAAANPVCNGTSANGTDVISSALSYIPEMAWNDDVANGALSSGGGGTSILFARPSWQTGVPGIPSGNFRLVPDVSLDASADNAGYLYCTSDTGTGGTNVVGSCANPSTTNFRATNGQSLTVAGGTSFAAPIFAAMVAIINQAKGFTLGSGLINPTLYKLAANSTTYASAFHDITSGGNQCLAGTALCGSGAGTTSYATTTGYDEATGLGSVDLYKLLTAWPAAASISAITATAATTTPTAGANDLITVKVTGGNGTPTGTVVVTDNGTPVTGSPFTLVNGTFTYTYNTTVTGTHTLSFTYSGDTNYGTSTAKVVLNVGSTSFTLSPSGPVTVTAGSSVTETITVSSTNGYMGTVVLGVTPVLANTCYTQSPAAILTSTVTSVKVALTIYTNSTTCAGVTNPTPLRSTTLANSASPTHHSPWRNVPVPATFAGLLILGCFKRRSKLLRGGIALGMVIFLGFSGIGLTGCSSGATGNTSAVNPTTTSTTNAATGTYNFTVSGNDSVLPTLSATTTFTLTIQ
jgi:subtilase family serine protease